MILSNVERDSAKLNSQWFMFNDFSCWKYLQVQRKDLTDLISKLKYSIYLFNVVCADAV